MSWQSYLVGALLYLALSLPMGRLARWAETQVRGVGAAAKADLTRTAIQVLLAAMGVGWICYLLTLGLALGNAAFALGRVLSAAALSIALLAFVCCTLGVLVYLLGTPRAVLNRPRPPSPDSAEPGMLAALSK